MSKDLIYAIMGGLWLVSLLVLATALVRIQEWALIGYTIFGLFGVLITAASIASIMIWLGYKDD